MSEVVRGDPARLAGYTAEVGPSVGTAAHGLEAYRGALAAYHAAGPNDLGHRAADRSGTLSGDLDLLRDLDRAPAAFADALRALDRSHGPAIVLSADLDAFRRQLAGSADTDVGLPGWLAPFFLGDVANFWHGGEDGFPVGALTAGGIRVLRVRKWMGIAAAAGPSTSTAWAVFPTFNTGFVGKRVATFGARVPWQPVARGAEWLTTPGATQVLRRFGVVGGGYGTITGAVDLYQQGNPIDAYRASGAGYVADVASTAFSASTTAFFIAPNPITGGAVIVTGVVWVGAEVVDNWDDITDFVGDVGSGIADVGGSIVSGAADLGGSVVSGVTDFGGSVVSGIGGLFDR